MLQMPYVLPYKVSSGSGVMFDALAHGLPFVATDLEFFKEFAAKGLGITVRRDPDEFCNGLVAMSGIMQIIKNLLISLKRKLGGML